MILNPRNHFMGQMCGLLQVTLSRVLVIYVRNMQWPYQSSLSCKELQRLNWLPFWQEPCLDGGKLCRSIIKRHCELLSSNHILYSYVFIILFVSEHISLFLQDCFLPCISHIFSIICWLSLTFISEVVKGVSRLIALALDLDVDFFDQPELLGRPIATLRLLHYEGEDGEISLEFSCFCIWSKLIFWFHVKLGKLSDPSNGIFGAGAHSDYGLITLLATDNVCGLQVHH